MVKWGRLHVSTALMLLCWTSAWASRFSFLKYEVDDGLANNSVRCIVQDSIGFMWFGTADGLSRFDGKQYRNYYRDSSDPDALGNSSVYALYVAAGGKLWVGTAGGVLSIFTILFTTASGVFPSKPKIMCSSAAV